MTATELELILKKSDEELLQIVHQNGDAPTKENIEKWRKIRANCRRIDDMEHGIDPDLGTM